jgi:hypothetical protein
MANVLTYQAYLRGTGRNPNLRVWLATFSGNAGALNTETLNFNTAGNPNGLEDFQVPSFTGSFAAPMILGSTTGGNIAELQIGGNGTAGECGISFYSAGNTPITSGSYSSAGFPAGAIVNSVQQYGNVWILTVDNAG